MSTTASKTELTAENFLRQLLEEQADLSAVEQFSALPDATSADSTRATEPAQAKYYRSLLPTSLPAPDEQYAFEVDLDACSGCKACVVACHTLNGLEEEESWRQVGALATFDPSPRISHVTTACHHCTDPGCLNGCPVLAYDKDPVTGIVRHLDDQCIGCKYCTMMCPYEVPRYSSRLGIVRKCDMCHQRLTVGEAPACVQACPNEAISIGLVAKTRNVAKAERLVPSAPLSSITRPTTRYVGAILSGDHRSVAQDADVDTPAESHWPLAGMLVLTQASVGTLLAERVWNIWTASPPEDLQVLFSAWLLALAGLAIAMFHLGQPLRAWRVFLGLRTSWLSREAVVFGQYMGLLSLVLLLETWGQSANNSWYDRFPSWLGEATLWATIASGICGLLTSGMIYIATQRSLWSAHRTLTRFLGTACVLGCMLVAMLTGSMFALTAGLAGAAAKLLWEWHTHLRPESDRTNQSHHARSRRLACGPLAAWRQARLSSGLAGASLGILGLGAVVSGSMIVGWTLVGGATICVAVGELTERWLYFSSVVYDRMPGVLD